MSPRFILSWFAFAMFHRPAVDVVIALSDWILG